MENIIKPNDSFDFTKLTLSQPSSINGGAYFTKIEYNNNPLYIQTTKHTSKQGIVKSGKKHYLDLMFDHASEIIINWFENIEEKCKKLIYEKREEWFQNSLEESDIDNAFNSIIRIYKSGKYYLVRTNIKNNQVNEPAVKIYNEYEVSMKPEDIRNNVETISILEIQGIKFTSRNFQIEIELKQMMVLDDEILFNNCLIKSDKTLKDSLKDLDNVELGVKKSNVVQNEILNINIKDINDIKDIKDIKDVNVEDLNIINTSNKRIDINENINDNVKVNDVDIDVDLDDLNIKINDVKIDDTNLFLEIEELKDINDDTKELREIAELEINPDLENLEKIILKKPNQVYFDLYKEARKKAKLAKQNAVLAYLEAKNIKKTYMLENIQDIESDSDFDEDDLDYFDEDIKN
jgi:hypothetical protein